MIHLNICSSKFVAAEKSFARYRGLAILSILFLLFFMNAFRSNAQVGPGTATVNIPAGGFHIEGNLQANTPTAGVGDWLPSGTVTGSGGYVLKANGAPVDSATTFHLTDAYNTAENNFSGGKKFNDNPNNWTWVTNPALAKCDINNAMFHFTKSIVSGVTHTWLIVAADRRSNSGSAYIDFEFYQKTVTANTNGTFTSAGLDGGRTAGDLLLTLALTNGGGTAEFYVNRWQSTGATTFDYVDKTSVTPAGAVYAATNASSVPVSFSAFGGNTYGTNLFVEAAIDLTKLFGAIDPCTSLGVKTLFVKTKTSPSPTATIVDFISPQQVQLQLGLADAGPNQSQCSNAFSVTGTATPSPGDAVSGTTWSVVSGTANIAAPSSATTGVTVTSSSAILKYEVRTTFGCTVSDTLVLTVLPAPTANAGADFTKTCTAFASGGTIGETAVSGFTYSWVSTPAGFTSTLANPTVNPTVNTTYIVTKTNTASGCFASDSVTVTINNTPVTAEAGTAFTKTCVANTTGGTIGEAAVSGFTYSWSSSPAGFSSTLANPTVNPLVTTVYTVTKTNTSSGCFGTDTVSVTVNNTPVTVAAGADFTKTCVANTSGGTIGETAVSGFTYSWSSSPGSFSSADANPTVNPLVTTSYIVTKTNTASGCVATDTVTVTVDNAAVTAEAGTGFTKTCADFTTGGAIGETEVSGFTYSWSSSPAGFTSALANPTVNPDLTTLYTVTKTNSSSGCSATDTVTVTVNNTSVTAEAGTGFTKTCVSNTDGGTIGEAAVSGFTYSWSSSPAGFSSALANPTVNPLVTTIYTVTKTNNSSGCFASDTVTVAVNNTAVTAEAGNGFTKTCVAFIDGDTIGESASDGFTYSWSSSPAGFNSDEANPAVNPSATTVYRVTKTNTASGCFSTDSVTVYVSKDRPAAPSVCIVQPSLCGPTTGSVTILSPIGADYVYSIDNGANWQAGTDFTNLAPGSVTGIVVKRLSTGCYSDAADCNASNCTLPAARTQNTSARPVLGTGNIMVKETTVKAFPNPFGDRVKFVVSVAETGTGTLEVFNMLGQKIQTVYQGYLKAGVNNFELSLPNKTQSNLVYKFSMGGKTITGKLIQLK